MKRWLILAALVVGLTATATVAVQYLPTNSAEDRPPFPGASESKQSGPKPVAVVTPELTYQFGALAQRSEIKREWTIKNEGDADLVVFKGPPACSCTVSEFQDEKGKTEITIKPGQETKIHLTFATKDFGPQYQKSAFVTTNDAEHPRFDFAAHGEVYPPIVLVPADKTLYFATISNDTEHVAKIALYSKDHPDVKVLKVTSSKPDAIVPGVAPLSQDECTSLKIDRGYRISITVKPGLPLGGFREEVEIETDHPKQNKLSLTVGGKVLGPITTSPDQVRLYEVPSKTGKKAELTLVVRGLRETRFTLVEKPEQLKVEIIPPENSKIKGRYRLTVTVPPGTAPGEIQGEIVLETDHPDARIVKIPVDILVLSAG